MDTKNILKLYNHINLLKSDKINCKRIIEFLQIYIRKTIDDITENDIQSLITINSQIVDFVDLTVFYQRNNIFSEYQDIDVITKALGNNRIKLVDLVELMNKLGFVISLQDMEYVMNSIKGDVVSEFITADEIKYLFDVLNV